MTASPSEMSPAQLRAHAFELLAEADAAASWDKGACLAARATAYFAAAAALNDPAPPAGLVAVDLTGAPGDVQDVLSLLDARHIHLDTPAPAPAAAAGRGPVRHSGTLDIAEWRRYLGASTHHESDTTR